MDTLQHVGGKKKVLKTQSGLIRKGHLAIGLPFQQVFM